MLLRNCLDRHCLTPSVPMAMAMSRLGDRREREGYPSLQSRSCSGSVLLVLRPVQASTAGRRQRLLSSITGLAHRRDLVCFSGLSPAEGAPEPWCLLSLGCSNRDAIISDGRSWMCICSSGAPEESSKYRSRLSLDHGKLTARQAPRLDLASLIINLPADSYHHRLHPGIASQRRTTTDTVDHRPPQAFCRLRKPVLAAQG